MELGMPRGPARPGRRHPRRRQVVRDAEVVSGRSAGLPETELRTRKCRRCSHVAGGVPKASAVDVWEREDRIQKPLKPVTIDRIETTVRAASVCPETKLARHSPGRIGLIVDVEAPGNSVVDHRKENNCVRLKSVREVRCADIYLAI